MVDFRKILKEERKRQGLTCRQLAEKSGYSAFAVWSWENERRNPKFETVEDILSTLGIELIVRRKK